MDSGQKKYILDRPRKSFFEQTAGHFLLSGLVAAVVFALVAGDVRAFAGF